MISFLNPLIYCMLTYAPCVDEYSVHKMNPDSHLNCEVPATVNVYRGERRLSDVDSHYFKINPRAVRSKSVSLNLQQITINIKISNEK